MSSPMNSTRKWLLAGTILTSLAIVTPAMAQDQSAPTQSEDQNASAD